MIGRPRGSVTVPCTMAAWVERHTKSNQSMKRQERRDRTGMEIPFSPGTRVNRTSIDARLRLDAQAGSEEMVTPGRLELPTNSLGNCCSIHLSYGAPCLN